MNHLKECGNRPPDERPVPKARPRKRARKAAKGGKVAAATVESRTGHVSPGVSDDDARVAALQKELAECDAVIAQAKEK